MLKGASAVAATIITAILLVVITIVIQGLVIGSGPCVPGNAISPSLPMYMTIITLIFLLILVGYAGYRIFETTVSIGRRILFFSILFILVIWPILYYGSGSSCVGGSTALSFGALLIGICLLFTVMLAVMMTTKDISSSLLLIPLILWLFCIFVMNFKVANRELGYTE